MITQFLDRVPNSQFAGSSRPYWPGGHLRSSAIPVQCVEFPELSVLFPFSALVYKAATTDDNDKNSGTVIG